MPAVRELVGLENAAMYSVSRHYDTTGFERWHEHGMPIEMPRLARKHFAATQSPVFYNLVRPPVDQRNRVMEATAWIDRAVPGTWETSALCREVFTPLGMQHIRQLRVLVCEGPVLLAWFGGMQADPVTRRQRRVLSALVPAMRRRLSVERRLEGETRTGAALGVALEALGCPAFLVGAIGRVFEVNAAARALLAHSRAEVLKGLRDAVARRPAKLAFELVEFRGPGLATHYLAILRPDANMQIVARARASASHWRLTPQQSEVLELITRGLATATIAAMLRVSQRAIELHVTAIFDRVGVVSHAALIAQVLVSEPR